MNESKGEYWNKGQYHFFTEFVAYKRSQNNLGAQQRPYLYYIEKYSSVYIHFFIGPSSRSNLSKRHTAKVFLANSQHGHHFHLYPAIGYILFYFYCRLLSRTQLFPLFLNYQEVSTAVDPHCSRQSQLIFGKYMH